MERTRGGATAHAEDLLRQLAAAVNAVRLYPVTSPLRTQAIVKFTRDANEVTALYGSVPYHIDRKRFIVGETAVGEGLPQVAALAETLHALQAGQLIVAPELGADEVASFLEVIGGDASSVRARGGVRAALVDAGVANMAVVEVSLRTSSEQGLLGIDLTAAPTDEIAREIAIAVDDWAEGASARPEGNDVILEAVGRLEPAARDLAMRRCAEALLLLDEATRTRLLDESVPAGPAGPRMDGMLGVVGHMPPSALARLLRLTAEQRDQGAESLLGAIEFPSELAEELAAMLRPSPQSEAERGVPAEPDITGITAEVADTTDDDLEHIRSLIASSTPRAAAARGLATTLQIASASRSIESVKALVDALRPAVRESALAEIAQAQRLLQDLAEEPQLLTVVQGARALLHDQELFAACARELRRDPNFDPALAILQSAGPAGAEALLMAYLELDETGRSRLTLAIGSMLENVAPIAGRMLRAGDVATAAAVLGLLDAIGSRRMALTVAAGLEHLDAGVRARTVVTLADNPGPETTRLLQKALAHWDPETRRVAARQIGRTRNEELVPALIKIVAEVNLFERNYELKKEVLKSLEELRSPKAVPVLQRLSRRGVLGKKNRELRYLASRALQQIEREGSASRKGNA